MGGVLNMKVLIACEFSGRVRDAFIAKGHNAISCDFEPSERPGPHYQEDVREVMYDQWDLMIAHPPCEYLTVSANRHFLNNPERWEKRLAAVKFVHYLMNVDIPMICIENPVGVISTHIRKPDQYIQPYEFGHSDSKKTGLWLKNLPPLKPTKIVKPEWITAKNGKRYSKTHWANPSSSCNKAKKIRSRTYQGIADAMAEQWNF